VGRIAAHGMLQIVLVANFAKGHSFHDSSLHIIERAGLPHA
jgi:hypothetical protein